MAKHQALEMRFSSELAIWQNIMRQGGARLTFDTPGRAINTMFRLNNARARLRARDGTTDYDLFTLTCAKGSNQVIVEPRRLIECNIEPLFPIGGNLELETEE